MKHTTRAAILVLLGALIATPAGASGPKKLKQPKTFPITITAPGSYVLEGNLTVPDENTTAISVQADYVTIDLNGFSIQGPVVCTGFPISCSPSGGTGVGVQGVTHVGLTVRNGSVHGMGDTAVNAADRVENVTVQSNGRDGVFGGQTVTACVANGNGFRGIENAFAVSNCTANGNAAEGIIADTVTGCIANGNGGDGIAAVNTVTNSSGYANGGFGINATTVSGCTALSNGLNGIIAKAVTNCTAQFNTTSPQISAVGVAGHNICGSPGSPCP